MVLYDKLHAYSRELLKIREGEVYQELHSKLD